ncbi:MAG TPA: hypothetical protein HA340_00400 [Candidatus Thalassarchaeaceae archaeon]|jgi:SepF-like predicted cell division protein (DUF552 family)|nr:hypothetical protein [Euryarchaeota archaeon]MDP6379313.1 hypothetical protein [Candidatus Thalassarchaeaceae archaeon]DAC52262.1 MAG TPA: hypothetical protein D7H97_00380 [Candidatus Poseidoniales archaeon]HIH82385.1 hypothetical protein [Candidatus Thalassarchaeaceae archaeon]|tara:strand:+ start:35 stop:514 length:480 start_codon:yes stop_codon:yes gene_type:complete
MSNIYSFFGLPDPNEGIPESASVAAAQEEIQKIKISEVEVLVNQKFHDLGERKWQIWSHSKLAPPKRAIRYVEPDNLHRLPTHGITQRLLNGDMVVVDLRDLKHMKAQQDACRRELGGMSERLGAPVFALNSVETLLLVPGAGAVVDTTSHHLGIPEEV